MKTRNITLFFLISAVIFDQALRATTLVYNMRIRTSFNINIPQLANILGKEKRSFWMTSGVPIIYTRDRKIIDEARLINLTDKRFLGGMLFNLRTRVKSWWAEVTTGIERETVKSVGTSTFKESRTGFDDVVLASGYNFFIKKAQFIIYGLAGFPTHRKVKLTDAQDPLVGTRFFSVGVGSEFSYSFINSLKRSFLFIFQNRFIHFFNRSWTPILPVDAKIQPGNVIDVLLAVRFREKFNIFETGYNATFFANQAVLLATQTIRTNTFVRHSGYASFLHLCKQRRIFKKPLALGGGFSIARSKRFDTKIFFIWGNMTLAF